MKINCRIARIIKRELCEHYFKDEILSTLFPRFHPHTGNAKYICPVCCVLTASAHIHGPLSLSYQPLRLWIYTLLLLKYLLLLNHLSHLSHLSHLRLTHILYNLYGKVYGNVTYFPSQSYLYPPYTYDLHVGLVTLGNGHGVTYLQWSFTEEIWTFTTHSMAII